MRTLGLIASVFLLAATGCNESTTGAYGNVEFTPDECGRIGGCAFEDSVGVGGIINVNIRGIDGFSTAGVTLESDDTSVLTVAPIGDVGGRPTWEAVGISAGVARIVAYDSDDVEVDFIEVAVQDLSGLGLENFVGDAVGPTSDATYDEIWQVNANQNTSFYVVPLIGDGAPTMGRYTYTPYLDENLDAGLLDTANVDEGYLYFNVPAGDYTITFESTVDTSLAVDVLIQAADVAQ